MWSVDEIQVWIEPSKKPLIQKPKNPAKELLSRYRSLIRERNAISDEILANFAKATSCTSRISPISSGGVSAAYDRIGENTCDMIDAQSRFEQTNARINETVNRIMNYLDAMENELEKEILIYRYIRGMSWEDIQETIHYERAQTYVIHGRALLSFNKLMRNS